MAKSHLMRLVTFLVLLKLVSSMKVDWKQVHKLLPPKDHMRIFRTYDIHKVPKYDVVHINWSKQQKRSVDGNTPLSLSAFGEEINLHLKRIRPLVGPFTPAYFFKTSSSGPNYTIEYPFIDYSADIYEDEDHLASLTVTKGANEENYIESGVIGARNLTIHRLPKRLVIERKSRMITSGNNYYIIQYMNDIDGELLDPISSNWTYNDLLYDSNVPIPDVIYPEILPLLDYSFRSKFVDNDDLFNYVLTFWSRVDMLYRSLKDPKYQLSIAGVAVAEDQSVFDFVKVVNNSLDFNDALNGAEKWLYAHKDIISIDSYDIAFIQTQKQSTKTTVQTFDEYKVTTSQLGLAELRGACNVDHYNSVVKKVGIIHDDGKYGEVLTAAHELGHTLGADHDPEKCGGDEAGFLMSGLTKSTTSNLYKWSECSLADLKDFLKTSPRCLYNVPDHYQDDSEPDIFSGDNEIPDVTTIHAPEVFDIRSALPAEWKVIGNPFIVLNNHRNRLIIQNKHQNIPHRTVYTKPIA